MEIIYLDNAATSHPKPSTVYQAVDEALRAGGNPGRGGHRLAVAAGRRVLGARLALAELFGVSDPGRLLFTANATDALNLAIKGLLRPGDHCITTTVEHNALRRPLAALARTGVEVTWLEPGPDGRLDPAAIQAALRPHTKMVALAHGSNVIGALQPLADVAEITRRAGVLLLLDAAQTAGSVPLQPEHDGIDLLATAGHKGLLGPQGTGVLYVRPGLVLRPLREGGTGGNSTPADMPDVWPEAFESGTANAPGLAGLAAGVNFLLQTGVAEVRRREVQLAGALLAGLRAIPGVTVYGPADPDQRTAVVSFTIAGQDPAEVEERLDDEYGILGRSGLHCNPGAHQLLGTFPDGTMRLSPGFHSSEADVERAVQAVAAIARR